MFGLQRGASNKSYPTRFGPRKYKALLGVKASSPCWYVPAPQSQASVSHKGRHQIRDTVRTAPVTRTSNSSCLTSIARSGGLIFPGQLVLLRW